MLTVRSDPPGAVVYVNGTEQGITPLDYDFTFYGTLDVEFRHAGLPEDRTGYRTEHVQKKLVIPWYEYFPLDFFSEFLVPWPITDHHSLDVTLTRYPEPSRDAGELGPEDTGRLDEYLTSIRETEIRTERADAWLDVPRPKISSAARQRTDRDVPQTQAGEYFRTMYDLIVLAFQIDATRVATFSSGMEGQGIPIPELGITQTRHALSHHNGDPGHMEKLTQSDTFAVEQYSYFISRLAESKDLNGKPLLDTTMTLFGSGMAYGHSHGNANLPLVLAGGTGLGLQHGSHLDLNQDHFDGYTLDNPGSHYRLCSRPANAEAHMSNLLLLMAQKMGVETDRFGDSNRVLDLA